MYTWTAKISEEMFTCIRQSMLLYEDSSLDGMRLRILSWGKWMSTIETNLRLELNIKENMQIYKQ